MFFACDKPSKVLAGNEEIKAELERCGQREAELKEKKERLCREIEERRQKKAESEQIEEILKKQEEVKIMDEQIEKQRRVIAELRAQLEQSERIMEEKRSEIAQKTQIIQQLSSETEEVQKQRVKKIALKNETKQARLAALYAQLSQAKTEGEAIKKGLAKGYAELSSYGQQISEKAQFIKAVQEDDIEIETVMKRYDFSQSEELHQRKAEYEERESLEKIKAELEEQLNQ